MSRILDSAALSLPAVFTAALWIGAILSVEIPVPEWVEPGPETLRDAMIYLPIAVPSQPDVATSAPKKRDAAGQGVGTAPAFALVAEATEATQAAPSVVANLTATDEPAVREGKRRKVNCDKTSPDITPTGEFRWALERSAIEYHTASIERLNALGWSKAYDENGQKGIYVSGFGCLSDPYLSGFRRGDVVQSVNGKKTNNFLQVWFTWQKVKKQDHFEVVVLRQGKRLVLTYDVV